MLFHLSCQDRDARVYYRAYGISSVSTQAIYKENSCSSVYGGRNTTQCVFLGLATSADTTQHRTSISSLHHIIRGRPDRCASSDLLCPAYRINASDNEFCRRMGALPEGLVLFVCIPRDRGYP